MKQRPPEPGDGFEHALRAARAFEDADRPIPSHIIMRIVAAEKQWGKRRDIPEAAAEALRRLRKTRLGPQEHVTT